MTLLEPGRLRTARAHERSPVATVMTASLDRALAGLGDDLRLDRTVRFARRFEDLVGSAGGRVVSIVDDQATALFAPMEASAAVDVGVALVDEPELGPSIGIATRRVGVVAPGVVVGPAAWRARQLAIVAPPASVLADVETLEAAGRAAALSSEPEVLEGAGNDPVAYQVVARCSRPCIEDGGWALVRVVAWDAEKTRGTCRTGSEHLYFDRRHLVGVPSVAARQRGFVVPRPPFGDGRNRVAHPVVLVGQHLEVEVEVNHGGTGCGGLTTGPVDVPPVALLDLGDTRPGTLVTAVVTPHRPGPVARVLR